MAPADVEPDMTETTTSAADRRRPLLIAAAVVAAALLAGTVALVAGGDEDDPPRLDLSVGAPAGPGGERTAESADLATQDMAAGTSMMAWVEYVAGDELEDLGGSAPVYRLVAGDDELRAIAQHLGVEGDVTAAEGNQRSITDGEASVNGYGASWWYTSGRMYPGSDPDQSVASACASPEGEPVDCEEPAPMPEPERPAGLPTQAEAEQIVRDIAEAAGLDLAGARVTAYDNIVTWSVNIDLALDGAPITGWSVYATVMEGGEVLDAGGTMGGLEQVGEYPLDTTQAAVDRLNEQQGERPAIEPGTEPAPETAVQTDPAAGGGVSGSEGSATDAGPAGSEGDAATSDVAPSDPGTEPAPAPDEMTILPVDEGTGEPITVTLRSAERSYTMYGSADGTQTYLVPVYLLDGDDDRGEEWLDVFALAVRAEFLGT